MIRTSRVSLLLGAAAAIALAGQEVKAQEQGGSINVSAQIVAGCTVDASNANLAFGTTNGTQVERLTSFFVDCSAPTDVFITLDGGQNPENLKRHMKHQDTEKFLQYNLFFGPRENGIPWNIDAEHPVEVVDSLTPAEVQVGGEIGTGATDGLPAGNYADVVGITFTVGAPSS